MKVVLVQGVNSNREHFVCHHHKDLVLILLQVKIQGVVYAAHNMSLDYIEAAKEWRTDEARALQHEHEHELI